MNSYSFVVARYLPDIVKNEPTNIGIIIHSTKDKTVYGKFIENFRSFSRKYSDTNINFVKDIVEGYRGKNKVDSDDYLLKLSKDFQYNLRFTRPPSGIIAVTPEQALEKLFKQYISIETKSEPRKTLTRQQLRGMVTKEIKVQKFDRTWIQPKQKIPGKIHDFVFDYGFKNGKVSDLLHTVSFDINPDKTLTYAKALAISVEDALNENDNLECTAIVHPPSNKKYDEDYYTPAVEYLESKNCAVKTEKQIPKHLLQIRKKLSHAS